jgi:preprotein translocase subunit SecA
MLETIFQNNPQKVLTKYSDQLDQINAFGKIFKNLTDVELRHKTQDLKERLAKNQNKTTIITEAFALVREASDRVLGLRHFDVQVVAGLVLIEGKIAEMKTGEGKTLVALLPTFFNALSGCPCYYRKRLFSEKRC